MSPYIGAYINTLYCENAHFINIWIYKSTNICLVKLWINLLFTNKNSNYNIRIVKYWEQNYFLSFLFLNILRQNILMSTKILIVSPANLKGIFKQKQKLLSWIYIVCMLICHFSWYENVQVNSSINYYWNILFCELVMVYFYNDTDYELFKKNNFISSNWVTYL